jgi:hypothetical protein
MRHPDLSHLKETHVMRTIAGIALIAGAAGVSFAAAPQQDILLQVTYREATEPVADGVRSDGLTSFTGAAAHYVHGSEDNALATLQSGGQYRFSTRLDDRKPLRRRLCFDFGTQPSPFGQTHCNDVLIGMHGDGRIADMRLGEVLSKRVRHTWSYDGFQYYLGFGTDWNTDGTYDTPFAVVSCVADDSSQCTEWTLGSDGSAILSRAQLLKGTRLGPTEFVGAYMMPFGVRFTRK